MNLDIYKIIVPSLNIQDVLGNKSFVKKVFNEAFKLYKLRVQAVSKNAFPQDWENIEFGEGELDTIVHQVLFGGDIDMESYKKLEGFFSSSLYQMYVANFIRDNVLLTDEEIENVDVSRFTKNFVLYFLQQAVSGSVSQTLDENAGDNVLYKNTDMMFFRVGNGYLLKVGGENLYFDSCEESCIQHGYVIGKTEGASLVYDLNGNLLWDSTSLGEVSIDVQGFEKSGLFIVKVQDVSRRKNSTLLFHGSWKRVGVSQLDGAGGTPGFQELENDGGIYHTFDVVNGYVVYTLSSLRKAGEIFEKQKSVLKLNNGVLDSILLSKEKGKFVGEIDGERFEIGEDIFGKY